MSDGITPEIFTFSIKFILYDRKVYNSTCEVGEENLHEKNLSTNELDVVQTEKKQSFETIRSQIAERTLNVLEFSKVQDQILQFVSCSLGRQVLQKLKPFSTRKEADNELQAVDEALRILYRYGALPFGGITDIKDALYKARIGGTLSASALLDIANLIAGARNVRQFIERSNEDVNPFSGTDNHKQPMYGYLAQAISPMIDARRTEQEIRQAIHEDGYLHDNASDSLRRIRLEKRNLEQKSRQTLDHMLRTLQKYLQDPIIALRGNAYCLPVRVEYKNQVRGIVRDYSSSGSTVFIEPQEVIEISQRISLLILDEEREIERILHQLSGIVAGVTDELLVNVEILGHLDAWFAKAEYAKRYRCERPNLTENHLWNLRRARHPLLSIETAVPLNVTIGENYRMLIVTGPNTGGKTVTLKTVGLLTLMAMSGCFIPTGQPSDIGWCSNIFADIGDEQSIEQSLSTFSSHMKNITEMLSAIDEDSLVLLDELGAGTDPTEGAALAIAILDHIKRLGASVVATTHYAELKGYAFQERAAMNASVEFDVQTLQPTYRLMVGVPGRSNALAIAERLGLPVEIIAAAKSHVGTNDMRMEELILQMEMARKEAELARDEAAKEKKLAQSMREAWQEKKSTLDQQLDRMYQDARHEAQTIVAKAEREANRIIHELRSRQNAHVIKDHELVELKKGLQEALPSQQKSGSTGKHKRISVKPGALVRVLSLGQKGEVLDVSSDEKTVTVQLGLLKMKVDSADLELLQSAVPVQAIQSTQKNVNMKDIRMELDVRGETVDDALQKIDKYIDDAMLSGLRRIVIIHGKGTGALRDAVRRHVAHHPQISGQSPGGLGEGGDGVTILQVKA